jgi:hypothetical protein
MKAFWMFRAVIIASSLAFAPVAFPCHAQTSSHAMSVDVPFSFEMGTKHFEPGTYTVDTPEWGVVEIRGNRTGGFALAQEEHSIKPTKTAKLVFDRYGDRYYLRQLWFSAEGSSYVECPESKSEKQTKSSDLASNSKTPSNVELAMLRIP